MLVCVRVSSAAFSSDALQPFYTLYNKIRFYNSSNQFEHGNTSLNVRPAQRAGLACGASVVLET